MDYKDKYIKYKSKYLELSTQIGAGKKLKKQSNYKGKNQNKLSRMESSNNIVFQPNYIENVSEPWFSLISLGLKSVEGRKNKGRFKEMKVGDIVEWTNNDFGPRSVLTKIIGKAEYPTFKEYLETEGLVNCLPTITDLEQGLGVYYKYYTKEDEKEYGVVAIRLEILN